MKTAYTYTVLRYVHDVVTGEFLNVGVVLCAPEQRFIKHKIRSTIGRIKQLFPDLDRYAYAEAARAVARGLRTIEKEESVAQFSFQVRDALSLARKALPLDDSALQWSPVGSGLTDDVEGTLERLYLRFVARYDRKAEHRKSDDDVWKPVSEKLASKNVQVPLEEKIVAGPTDSFSFKHAWKNGCWHAYEPISLDLSDAENIKDKARRIFGHLSAVADGTTERVKLHMLVGAPQNPTLRSAYENAIRILQKAPFDAEIFEETQIDRLVDRIENDVHGHITSN